ncbi:CDP-diacylglycerol---serine O-phosphatidyltransferase [Thermotomaculum hydrothermale]|uniref:CDP-diacylglycerol--serine O-phosphatidyltransferase n=1 Tax=Thermotomaculum hydrothermale TaxID=981385 RepID=A0A7R6PYY1_9BACT|nr:CDP-diacylglycerol--serine O-phosphatidyltransferase [Thermotomaculum hydrothermale]BBB32218.1 CDP-diacylglycerol---serine O-phosphatidyltransferase [Thermotomaculum hydrothermale]
MAEKNPRKGAFILPSLFTIANLFFGFSAILFAESGKYQIACFFVFVSAIMDMLDGRIARMTGTESQFGAELDSIVDVVSFGVAPAFIFYHWGFSQPAIDMFLKRLGWAAAFIFVSCGALRLARFNIQKNIVDSKYFVGVPIPIAAIFTISMVLRFPEPVNSPLFSYIVSMMVIFVALLMVSKIKYYSFKKTKIKKEKPYSFVIVIIILFAGLIIAPATILLLFAFFYLIHPFIFRNGSHKEPQSKASK